MKLTPFLTILAALSLGQAAAAETPLTLGVIAPMTGDFAKFGGQVAHGAELAIEQLRKEGIEAKLKVEDACLAQDAVRAIRQLIEVSRIDGLAGSYCVIGTAAIAPILKQQKLPSFHTSPISNDILKQGHYLFTTNVSIQEEASRVAEIAYRDHGARRAALLGLSTPWGQDYMKYFGERFEQLGGEVVSKQDSPIGQNDFRAELLRVRSSKPDLVFAAHISGMLGNLLKQARGLGLTQPFLGTDEAEDLAVVTAAGKAADGFEYILPEPESMAGVPGQVSALWHKQFGGEAPHSIGTNAYDATLLLGRALSKCGGDRECAREKLRMTKDFPGASGLLTLGEHGSAIKSFVQKEIRDGDFVRAELPADKGLTDKEMARGSLSKQP